MLSGVDVHGGPPNSCLSGRFWSKWGMGRDDGLFHGPTEPECVGVGDYNRGFVRRTLGLQPGWVRRCWSYQHVRWTSGPLTGWMGWWQWQLWSYLTNPQSSHRVVTMTTMNTVWTTTLRTYGQVDGSGGDGESRGLVRSTSGYLTEWTWTIGTTVDMNLVHFMKFSFCHFSLFVPVIYYYFSI